MKPFSNLSPQSLRWLLLCLGASFLPLIIYLPIWTTAFCLSLAAWRWWIDRHRLKLPSPFVRTVLLIALTTALLIEQQTIFGRDAGTAMFSGLLCLKLLELKSERDCVVIALLSFLLILSALLFSQTIIMCVYLYGAILMSLSVLLKIRLGLDSAISPKLLFRVAGKMILQSIPFALFLFFFFPRVQAQFAFQVKSNLSGLSDTMKPNDVSNMSMDQTVAFRASLPNQEKLSNSQLYWRGFVFWDTDGRDWKRGPSYYPNRIPSGPLNAHCIIQEITLMPHGQNWLFALDYPLDNSPHSYLTSSQTLEIRTKLQSKLQYTVTSDPSFIPQEKFDYNLKRGLRLPSNISPRVKALVEQWKSEAPTPEGYIDTVLNHFRTEFRYTLSPGTYQEDALEEFLIQRKQGFCEHFAGAFAILMRLNGIPSRVIAGYQGGDYNPYGNFWIVRQAHAHAWCEVWLKNKGWIRIDPTTVVAPDRISFGIQSLYPQSAQSAFDAYGNQSPKESWQPAWIKSSLKEVQLHRDRVEFQWDRWLVGYNTDTQIEVFSYFNLTQLSSAFLLVGGFILFAVILALFIRYRPKPKLTNSTEDLYRSFCKRLEAKGVPRDISEGPMDFSQRASEKFPSERETIQNIGWLYALLRYGKNPEPQTFDRYQSQIQSLQLDSDAVREESRVS
jgi:protein-glutamine gamma-glutamyltransferase